MPENLVIRFAGQDADDHRIPAYEGSQSLQGLSRTIILVGHYMAHGAIRQRAPFTDAVNVYLRPPRRGSFESILEVVVQNGQQLLGGALGASLTENLVTEALKTVFERVVGRDGHSQNDTINRIQQNHPGDFEALVDAVEPAVVQGHTAIENGAQTIVIVRGDHNIVNLNRQTKQYVSRTDLADDEEIFDVSVGSLNANSGYGRIFLEGPGKTVPFQIAKHAHPRTKAALASSLDRYANDENSLVEVRFRRLTAPDGRTKKLLIYDAQTPGD